MKHSALLMCLVCLGNSVSADTLSLPQEFSPYRPSPWAVAGEAGNALVCGVVGGVGLFAAGYTIAGESYTIGLFGPSEGSCWVGLTCGSIGYVGGSALGTWAVGSLARQRGTVGGALLGATIGLAVGAGLVLGGATSYYPLIGVVFAAPPAGAVIGYNLGRPKEGGRRSFNGRLGLPGLAVRQERLPDGAELTVYDARLVTVRF